MREIIVETLKRNIKSLRVRAGYTQEEVAEKLELSRETVFRWEKDPQKMPAIKLQ